MYYMCISGTSIILQLVDNVNTLLVV